MIGALVAGITGSGGASLSSYESIATATLSSTTTANFSSIPSTFKHLQLRWILTPASNTAIKMDFNGDTTSANYVVHDIYGNGTTVAASGITSYGSHLLKGFQNALSTQPNVGIVDILDYGSTTKNKTTRIFSGVDANGSGSVEINSGLYISTNAITSLSVYSSVNLTGTVALYGIKEA